MNKVNIGNLRKRYTKNGLVEKNLPEDPMDLFRQWFEEAVYAEVTEPNAMALATADTEGTPRCRMVLLKGIGDQSITFFTNYESRKAQDLAVNPKASVTFWWAELERQVLISGPVSKVSQSESEDYFKVRPRESRIGAWASDQSRSVSDRDELDRRYAEFEKKFEGEEIPKPPHWGGYELAVNEIEFWQGRPGRLHDRICYRRLSGLWNRERLAP